MNAMQAPAICLTALMLLPMSNVSKADGNRARRPNIVLLLADDLGWTGLGCFGSDFYETPNLDRLANNGVKFTNAYSACTVCSPTRASIMTGMSPARLHLTDFISGQDRPYAKLSIPNWTKVLTSSHITIAEVLRDAGYATCHVGKWHLNGKARNAKGTFPTDQGFDVSHGRPPGTRGYFLSQPSSGRSRSTWMTDALTDRACEFIDRSAEDPFFLYFAYHVPHTPIQGRPDLVEKFQQKVRPGLTHRNPTYAAMVASLDESVGRIVSRLEQNHLLDNTLVVFISDNGGLTQRYGMHDGFTENLPLRRGKGSAYEGGRRVPAIVSGVRVRDTGVVCETPIITTDLFYTLKEVAGVEVGPQTGSDGRSLVPLLENAETAWERDLFWHYPHYHAGGDSPYSAIRSGKYRLIEFHEDNAVVLYDLESDAGERTDLAQQRPDVTRSLLSKLHAWRRSVSAQMPTPNPNYDPARAQQVRGRRPRKVS